MLEKGPVPVMEATAMHRMRSEEGRQTVTGKIFAQKGQVDIFGGSEWSSMHLRFPTDGGGIEIVLVVDEPYELEAAQSFRHLVDYFSQNPVEIDNLFGLYEGDTVLERGEPGRTWDHPEE